MIFNPQNRQLAKNLKRLIPQIQQIICSKFVNYLTINFNPNDYNWAHYPKIINGQHVQAIAYLHANFKNHIINRNGITNLKKITQYLQQSQNEQLLEKINPSPQKKAEAHRKQFYIFDNNLNIKQLMECELLQNKSFNKIICFPKTQPLEINPKFQHFCLNHNVRALGLTDFSIKSLIHQIDKTTNRPTLIHEIVQENLSIYNQPSGVNAPTELIVFLNKLNQNKLKGNKFLSFKQITKNYFPRQTFINNSTTKKDSFKILRFQHLTLARKYAQAIALQQAAQEGEQE